MHFPGATWLGVRNIKTEISDEELIRSSREGDSSALENLYSRHYDAGFRFARRLMTNKADAEDIAQEAFLKVAAAMARGNGPDVVFRPYLLRTVRTAAADRWNEQAKETLTANTGDSPVEDASIAAVLHRDDPELVMKAFQSLPVRWMTVLWHAEVEREPPRRIAPVLGMEPGAVSALLLRARKGLREAYLNEYAAAPPRAECEPTFPYLAATVLGTNSARDRRKVKEHTRDCEDCAKVLAELSDVGATMRGILAPMLLIPTGFLLPEAKLLPKSAATTYGVGLTAAAVTVTIAAVAAVGSLTLSADTVAVPVVTAAPSSVSQTAPTQQFIPTSGPTTAPPPLSDETVAAAEPASVNDYRPNEPVPRPLEAGQRAIAAQFKSPAASVPAGDAATAGSGPPTTPAATPTPTATATPTEPVPEPSPTPTDTPTSSPTPTPTPTPTDPPTEPDCIVILVVCVSG